MSDFEIVTVDENMCVSSSSEEYILEDDFVFVSDPVQKIIILDMFPPRKRKKRRVTGLHIKKMISVVE